MLLCSHTSLMSTTLLPRYATSESRLTEVLDTVCSHSDMNCIGFLEEYEEFVEQWFIGREVNVDRLRHLLCVDEAKVRAAV